jgi:hypothetical protein
MVLKASTTWDAGRWSCSNSRVVVASYSRTLSCRCAAENNFLVQYELGDRHLPVAFQRNGGMRQIGNNAWLQPQLRKDRLDKGLPVQIDAQKDKFESVTMTTIP